MSKDRKRTETKNKPKLTTKEKKAKKNEKKLRKAGDGGIILPK